MNVPALLSRLVLLFSGIFLFNTAVSAQVSSALIEEVVVTAQKREESVQDVPIAISAMSQNQLDALNVKNTDDLLKAFPNLSVKPGGASNTGFSIRGVGTDNFHVTAQQAVGQYLDEVTLISPFVSSFGKIIENEVPSPMVLVNSN